ncbi:hypothetical protein [Amycolatopsis kentuckyensis]|uniref:hypothetical protein n=1 Tax=Amycolatopsis kentuckyensis TaxID=218823 RepID=UPI003567CBC7
MRGRRELGSVMTADVATVGPDTRTGSCSASSRRRPDDELDGTAERTSMIRSEC